MNYTVTLLPNFIQLNLNLYFQLVENSVDPDKTASDRNQLIRI